MNLKERIEATKIIAETNRIYQSDTYLKAAFDEIFKNQLASMEALESSYYCSPSVRELFQKLFYEPDCKHGCPCDCHEPSHLSEKDEELIRSILEGK